MLLRNANIVLPDRITEPSSVLIEGDRIARIFDAQPPSSSIRNGAVIDLAGLTLWPGFIDIHIHGAVGIDTMEATTEGLLRMADFLARQGVTSWLPTLVPAAIGQYQHALEAIRECLRQPSNNTDNARVLGVHYEGPFVNSEQCGALHREHFRTFRSPADLDELPVTNIPGAIHMMTLAPEIDGGIDLVKELDRRGWITSIGHTRATLATLDQAKESGARHMTHFMNAMTPLHHRAVGAVGWGLLHDDVTIDLIADGIHVDRSILQLILRNKTTERVSLISDAIAATGKGDGNYQIWGETIEVKNGRTQNSSGAIAGSVITMLDAVRTMMSLGFSESKAAKMASTNPARLLGIDHECGSIEEGKRADFVALDKSFNVRASIIAGQIRQY